jgi:tRNA-specific 2-thiouridylase
MPRAVVLFSGGLDSMLVLRILQQQGLEVHALNVRAVFSCCQTAAARAAVAMGAELTVLSVEDDYLDIIRHPRYGYGKGANPCVDCRMYMCKMAKRFMEQIGASLVATGEILGQRPMSQKRQDLVVIEKRSGLQGRLLRPLSAKLLPPTIPEEEGIVDREKLYDFSGRSRVPLIELAGELGIQEIPQPSTGCALTEPMFSTRVFDLMEHDLEATRWDFELLVHGRQFRITPHAKIVIGRNESENASLGLFAEREDASPAAFIEPENFMGPDALVTGTMAAGEIEEAVIELAAAMLVRYSRRAEFGTAKVRVTHGGESRVMDAKPNEAVGSHAPL